MIYMYVIFKVIEVTFRIELNLNLYLHKMWKTDGKIMEFSSMEIWETCISGLLWHRKNRKIRCLFSHTGKTQEFA